jgi:hypothetical protein
MRVADDECEELRRLYLEHEGVALTLDEAREMLSRLLFLFERFAAWIAKEKAAGQVFPLDEHPPVPEGSEPPQ